MIYVPPGAEACLNGLFKLEPFQFFPERFCHYFISLSFRNRFIEFIEYILG